MTLPPAPARARALAHVSIATPDAEATAREYESLLGATVRSRETLADRGLHVVFLDCAGVPIELIQPVDPKSATNTVAKFLAARGPGLHHVAFFVDDAASALDHARSSGARLVDETPRAGADDCLVAFLHPSAASGVLVEFVERHLPHWDRRLAELWASLSEDTRGDEFVRLMDALTAELPPGNGIGAFERASAFDSTGRSDLAVPLYREALTLGLEGERRRRAVIQLASSLRNLGEAKESVALLTAERKRTSDPLDDAVLAVLALSLVDTGKEREAASIALAALARHLPRYQRSMANYARELGSQEP